MVSQNGVGNVLVDKAMFSTMMKKVEGCSRSFERRLGEFSNLPCNYADQERHCPSVRVLASSGAGNKRVFDDENERNGASVSEGRGLLLRSLAPDVRRRCFLYDTSTTKPLVMGTPIVI